MIYSKRAYDLFAWNRMKLLHSATIQKSELALFFAPNFTVIANGKRYEATYDNYLEFLNSFRATIHRIEYEFGELIESHETVVIPLKARITRTSKNIDQYDAILILKFNDKEEIVLWHEVYVQIESETPK